MLKPHLKCIIRNNNRYYWAATLINNQFLIVEVDESCNIINETPIFRTHDELIEKKARVIGTFDKSYETPITTILLQKMQKKND
jgi:hypothetical protein